MKGNKICATCRSSYNFCQKCSKDKDKPLWYFTFCSQNCHDIYETTSNFENGKIDADEAKLRLNNLNLSKLDNFGESYKKSINKIMGFETVKNDVIVEDLITEENVDDIIEKQVDEEEINKTTENVVDDKVFKKSRNKRTRINVEE